MSITNQHDYRPYPGTGIYFSAQDQRRLKRQKGNNVLVSTVCPDFSNTAGKYCFSGELGTGISLTAAAHLASVPALLEKMNEVGQKTEWLVLVADLPELVESQAEFYQRIAGSKEQYIARCEKSVLAIRQEIGAVGEVATFSSWYGQQGIDYLSTQEQVAEAILAQEQSDQSFATRFAAFCEARRNLATKFRGRQLTSQELKQAAAHGMSLYVTHGTLLRLIFKEQGLVVINHSTPNLHNFFLHQLVPGSEALDNKPKFPVGIIKNSWY